MHNNLATLVALEHNNQATQVDLELNNNLILTVPILNNQATPVVLAPKDPDHILLALEHSNRLVNLDHNNKDIIPVAPNRTLVVLQDNRVHIQEIILHRAHKALAHQHIQAHKVPQAILDQLKDIHREDLQDLVSHQVLGDHKDQATTIIQALNLTENTSHLETENELRSWYMIN